MLYSTIEKQVYLKKKVSIDKCLMLLNATKNIYIFEDQRGLPECKS